MKIGTLSRASKFSFAIATLAALLIASSVTFAGGNNIRPVSPPQSGFNILPAPPANGGGGQINPLTARTWNSIGTDWNTDANWTGLAPTVANAVGVFTTAETVQPNLSASVSIAGIIFSGTGTSGYDITSTGGATFTLNGTAATGSGGTSNSSAAPLRGENTSGTNTVDAPIILGAASGAQVFFQAAGGTLVVNSVVSSTSAIDLSLKGAGTIQLNGPNTFSGGASIDQANTTVVLGNNSAFGTGTFTNSATSTIQASSARTLANNVVLGGNMTISGSNPFTFNGTFTSSGSNSRILTVSNAGGTTTLAGNVFLSDSNSVARSLTIDGSSPVTISGVIANNAVGNTLASPLKYSGTSTLTLSNTNTYSGLTSITVAGGQIIATAAGALGTGNINLTTVAGVTLTLQGAVSNYIGDTANLSIIAGNTINLNFTGTDTIGALVVDGVSQPLGLYGSSATNSDGDFSGTGLLLVTAIAVPERSTWSMLVMGAALLLGVQRWRRRRTS